MTSSTTPNIPYDLYESANELFIIIPLGGVQKDSLHISLKEYKLIIQGKRVMDDIKKDFSPLRQECYWGPIYMEIDLPSYVYFDKIHSTLTSENILEIIVPKIILPESIPIHIDKKKS